MTLKRLNIAKKSIGAGKRQILSKAASYGESGLKVYLPRRGPEVLQDPRSVGGEDTLPGFVLDLAPIFDDPAVAEAQTD